MTPEQEREAFEAWHRTTALPWRTAWLAWSARASLAQPPTMFNGLTEAETDATASVFGLVGAQPASVPAEPNVGHSALAGLILTHLGYSTSPSLEPTADERRDRLAEKLAGWLAAAPQAPQPAQAVPFSTPADPLMHGAGEGYNAAICQRAAAAHGLTAAQAEECEDAQHGCPTCPWGNAAPKPEAQPRRDAGERMQEGMQAFAQRFFHTYWGAGKPGCPEEIKAPNGELFKLRCKKCGEDNPRRPWCPVDYAAPSAQAPQPEAQPIELTAAQQDRYKYMLHIPERILYEEWRASEGAPVVLEGDGSYSGNLTAQHDWCVWLQARKFAAPSAQAEPTDAEAERMIDELGKHHAAVARITELGYVWDRGAWRWQAEQGGK